MIDNDQSNNDEKQAVHSGVPGTRPGNTNVLKHGIYADRFLSPEEKPFFDAITVQLSEEFDVNKSSDFLHVELVAVSLVKLGRAHDAGDWDAVEKLDRMIRCHLRDLKSAKKGEKCLSRKKSI